MAPEPERVSDAWPLSQKARLRARVGGPRPRSTGGERDGSRGLVPRMMWGYASPSHPPARTCCTETCYGGKVEMARGV